MKVTASRNGPQYLFTGKVMRWESNSPYPNPLNVYECRDSVGSRNACSIGIGMYFRDKNGNGVGSHYKMFEAKRWMLESKTRADLVRAANRNGFIGSMITLGTNDHSINGVKQCMYLGYISHLGGGLIPFSGTEDCSYAELLPNICKISEDSLYIRHGTLSSNRVNGHSASTVLHVGCDTDMRVRIRPQRPQDYIVLDARNDLRSYISINGSAMGADGVVVNATTGVGAAVNITSTLANHRGQEGDFSGAMVIVVAIE